MAAEIPPDYFPTPPTLAGTDCFPDNMPVPASGIFDSPAHMVIINQEWVARLLGVFDGLMYPEAWESQDAETAYNELLELQAMLMSPANYLIPIGTFQNVINASPIPAGALINTLFAVPPGFRYKLTSAVITLIGGEPSLAQVRLNHSGKETLLIRDPAPIDGLSYSWSGEMWLYPGDQFRYHTNNGTAVGSVFVSASGLVYDEV